jgi:hypothetical protein
LAIFAISTWRFCPFISVAHRKNTFSLSHFSLHEFRRNSDGQRVGRNQHTSAAKVTHRTAVGGRGRRARAERFDETDVTQMMYYNQQCNDQTAKINNGGYTINDFSEIQSNHGIRAKASARIIRSRRQETDMEYRL